MMWLIMSMCIIVGITVFIAIRIVHTIVYEVRLIIQNKHGEFLLVFDGTEGRFRSPAHKVPFDEIPTRLVCTTMNALLPDIPYKYDTLFHTAIYKFDRVRDDVGALYCYEFKKRLRTYFSMYYILEADISQLPENVDKTAPFPQFYSLCFMENMSDDIRPSAIELGIYRKVVQIKGGNTCI